MLRLGEQPLTPGAENYLAHIHEPLSFKQASDSRLLAFIFIEHLFLKTCHWKFFLSPLKCINLLQLLVNFTTQENLS